MTIESAPEIIGGVDPEAAAKAAALAAAAKEAEAANAAAPKPEDLSKAPNIDTPEPDPVVVYEPTNDPGLDLALEFVGRFGIDADHPAMKKAQEGDFSHLETLFSALKDPAAKDYPKYLALGKAAYERQAQATADTAKSINAAVHDAAGGPEKWAEVRAWAAANADPDEKDAINALLGASPAQARIAVSYIMNAYNASSEAHIEPAKVAKPAASRAAPQGAGPLSQTEYASQVQALVAKFGTRGIEQNPEYIALSHRFLAGSR
jgi:hypothetical protein